MSILKFCKVPSEEVVENYNSAKYTGSKKNMKNPSSEDVEKFRNGIFLASSRTYGEKIIEPIIRNYLNLDKPESNDYDAIDKFKKRFEIKATKVLFKKKIKKNMSFLEKVIHENYNSPTNRLVSFKNCLNSNYFSNIQNVKRDHFDELIYIMMFEDCIKIFTLNVNDIYKGSVPNWSDKHGRYDELGKSGQFSITKNTIEWHLENTLKKTLSWSDVYELVKLKL
jgi:hypothetical protein